ncbi:hypothetical protein MM859_003500 [Escherichia coli]|nr:hypothetical protein [Escherichia coli]
MSAITKERIELFIKNPLDNGLTRGEQMELARIALASLEAKPIGAFHIAEQQVDGTSDYLKDGEWPIDNGIIEVYAAPPAPDVPAVLERLRSIVADPRALPRRKEWVSGQQYSYVLLENVEAMVDEACRASMRKAGNSPVTPDGWVMVPKELTQEMMRAVQIRSELGGYATSNLSGAYNMFSEFWNVAVSAAPKVDYL